MRIEALLGKLEGVTKQGAYHMALCPGHNDRNPSLKVSVNKNGWIDLKCFAGCAQDNILTAMGLTNDDLRTEQAKSLPGKKEKKPGKARRVERFLTGTYSYRDEDDKELFQVLRYEEPGKEKSIAQRSPDGKGGYTPSVEGVRKVLYRLPELLKADINRPVFFVEGEKKADELRQFGVIVTSAPGGAAAKWEPEYTPMLAKRLVIIIPDNDEPGRKHRDKVARALAGVAAEVRTVDLPGVGAGGDIADWLAAQRELGHTKEEILAELIRLKDAAMPYEAPPVEDTDDSAGADGRKHFSSDYAVRNGRIVFLRPSADPDKDDKEIPVASFTARIVETINVEGDGAIWKIAGEGIRGGAYTLEIAATDFHDTNVLKKALGAAVGAFDPISTGMHTHLPSAIQSLTDKDTIKITRRYNRTGWADNVFLIPGREPENVTISLPRKLPYSLTTTGDTDRGLCALTALCEAVGTDKATVILAALLSGPMALAAGWRNERYALFVVGRTGSLKTSTLQAAMSLYGPGFMRDEMLTKWGEGATGNAIMSMATAATDLPFLIDNFKPSTGGGDRAFVSLVHNILEGGEKDRLNRASELRESKPVHCWPVFTGEDAPTTDAAALARCLIVNFSEIQTQQNESLASAQAAAVAGDLAALGLAWIAWLETDDGRKAAAVAGSRLNERRAVWADYLRTQRKDAVNILRIASNLATNELAFSVAVQCPALSAWASRYVEQHKTALAAVAVQMGSASSTALEAHRFLDALGEILATGRYRLALTARADAENQSQFVDDRVIGWKDADGSVYIFPHIAKQAVEQVIDKLRVSEITLFSQLDGLGLLASVGKNSSTVRKWWGGNQRRVLHLKAAALGSDPEVDSEVFSMTAV